MARREETEERRHEGDVENRDDAHVQRAAQLSRLARQLLQKNFQVPENGAGVLLEDLAGGDEQDAVSPALKERDVQTRLQGAHLLRNTWLRNAKSVAGAAEAAGVPDP